MQTDNTHQINKEWGLQSWLSRKTGISRSTVTSIFSGKRRATPEQAILLEPLLIEKGYSITRWDLVSCPRGTKLLELVHQY